VRTISEHIVNIYNSHEHSAEATIRKFQIVQTEGILWVERLVDFDNLEMILAIGYRVRSNRASSSAVGLATYCRNYQRFRGPQMNPTLASSPAKQPLQLVFAHRHHHRPAVRAGEGIIAAVQVIDKLFHLDKAQFLS